MDWNWLSGRSHWALVASAFCAAGIAVAGLRPATGEVPPASIPRVLDPRLKIELVAQEPQIVTPVGIVVDSRGRPLVIESHTHFRPEGYRGPPADRIRRFEDTDGDGRADRIDTVYEGSTATMGLALEADGSLLVVTRGELFRLSGVDVDEGAPMRAGGVSPPLPPHQQRGADAPRSPKEYKKTRLAWLDTKERYPHNGLGGVAIGPDGNLYLSMGENFGNPYRVVGSDGRALSGEGDGGGIYRLRPDGSGLTRWATGFWNPFHLAFDPFGRLFAVDNDPDSRPPCRLLHIVEGGDYGFRMRNGRIGLHPYTSWFGHLPGTLGIMAGTGEAPSGILVYESDNLPEEYRGDLLVTSWGDHQIERYRLQPHGATFQSVAQPIVVGNEHFRPVGIAAAPDGSIYITDWVDVSYTLHGKGRIWRLKAAKPNAAQRPLEQDPSESIASADRQQRERAAWQLVVRDALVDHWPELTTVTKHLRTSDNPRARSALLGAMSAAGRYLGPAAEQSLRDADPRVQALAIRLARRESINPAALAETATSAEVRAAAVCRFGAADRDAALRWLGDDDPWIRQAARTALARSLSADQLLQIGLPQDPTRRLEIALLLRASGDARAAELLPELLADEDRRIRMLAVLWIGESRLAKFKDPVLARLKAGDNSGGMLELSLATLDLLDRGGKPAEFEKNRDLAVARLLDVADLPPHVLARLLRYLPPDHKSLSTKRLETLLADKSLDVRTEAVRTLRDSRRPQRAATLHRLATDETLPPALRAEAIVGISGGDDAGRRLLLSLAGSGQTKVRDEALRSLRGTALTTDEQKSLGDIASGQRGSSDLVARLTQPDWKPKGRPDPQNPAEWSRRFAAGNAAAGERVFFHAQGARCAACHRIDGRGGNVGPDLSAVGQMGAQRLWESILSPSREIAPQYVHWSLDLRDGRTLSAQLVTEKGDGKRVYADSTGQLHSIHRDQIEESRALATSVMPDGLTDLLTDDELRDLMAYLLRRR